MKGTMSAKESNWDEFRGNGNLTSPVDAGPGVSVFRVNSPAELTAANADVFGRQVSVAMHGSRSIELNLAGTKFLDCTGLGTLIALGKLARNRQGVLRVVNPRPSVRQLFEIMDAGRMFEIEITPPKGSVLGIDNSWFADIR